MATEFKIGDRVKGTGTDRDLPSDMQGEIIDFHKADSIPACKVRRDDHRVVNVRLKDIEPSPLPPKACEAEAPSSLPATLPIGTRGRESDTVYEFISEAKLINGTYDGRLLNVRSGRELRGALRKDRIDWESYHRALAASQTWTPKVGDRVRATTIGGDTAEGTIVEIGNGAWPYTVQADHGRSGNFRRSMIEFLAAESRATDETGPSSEEASKSEPVTEQHEPQPEWVTAALRLAERRKRHVAQLERELSKPSKPRYPESWSTATWESD